MRTKYSLFDDSTGHRQDINNLNPFKDAIAKHKSRSNFSKLKFANMQTDSEDHTNLDTLEEEEIECTQEELVTDTRLPLCLDSSYILFKP